ncbi:MAG: hypothetical protein FJZ90_16920 [Chloroflexi bacterium]|nr:hypothetical protein [Chloroflexota bacterium]
MSDETERADELSVTQMTVLSAMLAGKTQRKAAQEAGVAPETMTRWLAKDATFVAAWHSGRQEVWRKRKERLRDLADQALDAVSEILTDGEDDSVKLRAALAVMNLNDVGLGFEPGSTTAESVRRTWAPREQKRQGDDLIASFGMGEPIDRITERLLEAERKGRQA